MKRTLVAAFVVLTVVVSVAAQVNGRSVALERLMSAADFKTAGLHKLDEGELAALNRWLSTHALAAESLAVPLTQAAAIESRISGTFTGWEGETVFKLQNGQIWQQSSYAYHYHYAYSPEVTIYKVASGHRMKVDGVDQTINVRRIR
jgi:hypothetical protein